MICDDVFVVVVAVFSRLCCELVAGPLLDLFYLLFDQLQDFSSNLLVHPLDRAATSDLA